MEPTYADGLTLLASKLKPARADIPEIEFEEGEGEPIELLSCGIRWSPEQLRTINGEGGVDRSNGIHGIIMKLANAGKSQADIFATMLRHPPFWSYCLEHRRNDPDRAAHFAREEITRAFNRTAAGTQARVLAQWQKQHSGQKPEAANEDERDGNGNGLPKRKFEVVDAAAFAADYMRHAAWFIKGWIPKAGVGLLYGGTGSGKTFAQLGMCGAIATGSPTWHGCKVTQGRVVYVAAEGAGGFRKRLEAYRRHHGVDLTAVMGVIADAPNFLDGDDAAMADAIAAAGGAAIVVVDTLAASMPGGNENAGEDMGAVVAACQRLHAATGALILLTHHTGKDASKGARGWSGLLAAMDFAIEVTREDAGGWDCVRSMKVVKQKDDEDGAECHFQLRQVLLGADADGDAITSCVAVPFDTATQRMVRLAEFYRDYPKLASSKERRERFPQIFAALTGGSDRTGRALADALKLPVASINDYIGVLREAGLVEKEDPPRLTPKGVEIAAIVASSECPDRSGHEAVRRGPDTPRTPKGGKRGK